jgi:glucose-6-phosphate isomerase
LLLKRGNRLLEHFTMRWRSSRREVALRARKRQLDSAPAGLRLALFGSQGGPHLFRPLGFRLLEFDVFALETASHFVQYSIEMPDVLDKRARLQGSLRWSPGPLNEIFNANVDAAARAAAGLWRRDASVWSDDPATQQKVSDRLGWLRSPTLMVRSIDRLNAFARDARRDGVTDVVLLGMGGSSLAPEVLRAIVGVAPGSPRFHMLDSTDPAAVRAVAPAPDRTLYLLASKSGTTIEPNSLAAHFRERIKATGVSRWADRFVAITDEGTALARRAHEERFRDVFINPSDIGGRYSAMSFFGLVPAVLMGIDLRTLLDWSEAMIEAAAPDAGPITGNPAVALGLAIGAAARAGRDKLTLLLPPELAPFGLWVEQLIAESTGKNGTGVIPIAGEAVAPETYATDRLFVHVVTGPRDSSRTSAVRRDEKPVEARSPLLPAVEIEWPEPMAIGAEFVRWEIATAVAGALLRINPFDEPNVQQAKDATRTLLDHYKSARHLPRRPPDHSVGGIELTLSAAAQQVTAAGAIMKLVREGDYVALLAYLGPDPALADELAAVRRRIGSRTRAATMFGYGPRYLHSTGQLHKGGPNTGVFVLITAVPVEDVPIPDEPFSFGTLEFAQALGDFASLDAAGRRAVHAHLRSPDRALLQKLADVLLEDGERHHR